MSNSGQSPIRRLANRILGRMTESSKWWNIRVKSLLLFVAVTVGAVEIFLIYDYLRQDQEMGIHVERLQQNLVRSEVIIASEAAIRTKHIVIERMEVKPQILINSESEILAQLVAAAGRHVTVTRITPTREFNSASEELVISLDCHGNLDEVVSFIEHAEVQLMGEVKSLSLSSRRGASAIVYCSMLLNVKMQ